MQITSFDVTISPPASSYKRVLEMKARDIQPDIRELVSFLETDPVTVAHLLRQVNAPEYSLRQNVTSLERAVAMLGFDAVCNTIMTEWYIKKKEGAYTDAARKAYTYIVRTSVAAGAVARELVGRMRFNDASTVITCALLHQLGRFALLATDPVTYSGLWTPATTPNHQPISIPPGIGRELVHYRTDYARLGADIAREWELPAELKESIRFHSDPEKFEDADRRVIMVVAVAQITARSLYEPPEDLNRDQSATRVQKAFVEVGKETGMLVTELKDFLDQAKKTAYEKSRSLGLHPQEPAE